MNKRLSFKHTIRKFFMINALIPLTILVGLFLVFSIINAKQVVVRQAEIASDHISEKLEKTNEAYSQEIRRMSHNLQVMDFVLNRRGKHKIYEFFYDFNNRQAIRSNMFILDKEGTLLLSTAGETDTVRESIIQDMYTRIEKNPNVVTISEANSVVNYNGKLTVYMYGRQITSNEGERIGYIFYMLHEEDFLHMIFDETTNMVVITDEYDTIIATSNNSTRGFLNKFRPSLNSRGDVVYGENVFYMDRVKVPNSNIYVIALNSLQVQTRTITWLIIFLLFVSAFIMILLRHLSIRLSRRITVSIDQIIHAIHQFQLGNMNYYLSIKSQDEFELVSDQYNLMLDRINYLITQNSELAERRRISEVKQLESQFNPHFIFNVLETIRYAIVINPSEAEKSVLALSRLLRYSVDNHTPHVKLGEDVAYLEDFLALHKLRFGNRLDYAINLSDELKDMYVPKLLIQPLLENAIKHGYKKSNSLSIHVDISRVGESLIVKVLDNGGGMEQEQLKSIKKALSDNTPALTNMGVGLYNVHRRLILLYEGNKGLRISNVDDGLMVQFSIPIEEDVM
ncbi:sensor histidine kinase [Bacillus sp. HMF5848]|uniref:sensor histidine kinase n=1 Tax=Bacillus sp. HMF5848 TaxID=2495421 RepID=UPI000F78A6FE|nr:sensor histidine kinase [Bacillus sp. HMF5848]RSK28799.1 sensor histidine kinase [Bacillus sp. HMF5848]